MVHISSADRRSKRGRAFHHGANVDNLDGLSRAFRVLASFAREVVEVRQRDSKTVVSILTCGC
jgi:hypothetical protein